MRDHGTLGLSVGLVADRATGDSSTPLLRAPRESVRLDLVPMDGLGLWVEGAWRPRLREVEGWSTGWRTGGGLRVAGWFARSWEIGRASCRERV